MPETQNKEQSKKKGILKYLDNTIGEDGLRTDIKITLTNETSLKIIGVAVASTALSSLTFFLIRSFFIKKTN